MTTHPKLFLGRNHPATSLEAAQSLAEQVTGLRLRVLDAVRAAGDEGLTAEEVERATGLGGNTCRPRLQELREAGLVVRTERRRPTRSGRQAFVHVAGEPPPVPEAQVAANGNLALPL